MMLTLSFIKIIACSIACMTIVTGVPIRPDTQKLLTESLTEYYEGIADRRMYHVAEDALFYIPKSISDGDTQVRQNAEKSLHRNLEFMRASLMASIYPLVLTDTSLMKDFGFTYSQLIPWSQGIAVVTEDIHNSLVEYILTLNKRISHQLGLIVNAAESSRILVRQAAQLYSTPTPNTPSTVTVEWELRKPFQVHITHEQQQSKDVSVEMEWLYHQFMAIESNLLAEFDEQTEQALQIIKDTLSFNLLEPY